MTQARCYFQRSSLFGYWGKARPVEAGPDLHLLPYHSLDVAAVGVVYLRHQPALRNWLGRRLGTHAAAQA